MRMRPLPPGRVLVAVSGGPDSTALLLALHEAGRDIVAAHYDHALRERSDHVAQGVAALCASLGVSLVAERRTDPLPRGSLQAAARTLRYDFFERARASAGADCVATAHTADDLVEGVVLHAGRGCGLAGMRGMPPARERFVRPLLDVWRGEILDYLERRGAGFHEDPSNRDLRFARVRVRTLLLPALERDLPGLKRRLHAVAVRAARWHEAAVHQARAALAAGPPAASALRTMPEPVAIEVLKLLYVDAGGPEPGLGRAHFESMLAVAGPGRGGRGVDLPRGLRFRIVGDLMQVIDSRAAVRESRVAPRLELTPCTGCDDRDAVHMKEDAGFHVGTRTPGLRMRPLGGLGTRKLQDLFVDARVPREDRDAWPLVFSGAQLAWVPGVAVDATAAAAPGPGSVHVRVVPMPVRSGGKAVKLKVPKEPSRSA